MCSKLRPPRVSSQTAFRTSAALVLLLPVACDRAGDAGRTCPDAGGEALSSTAVEARIPTILPQGWKVADRTPAAVPYGYVPDPKWRAGAATRLTVVGPELVAISGYYCAKGTICPSPIDARESIEVWIVPGTFADLAGPPAGTARGAALIARCRDQAIYGLVSRYAGAGLDFDGGFTQASTETSRMPPGKGDLATSWQTWRQDLAKILR